METNRPTNVAVQTSPPELPSVEMRELRIDELRNVSGGQAMAAPRPDVPSFGNNSTGNEDIK